MKKLALQDLTKCLLFNVLIFFCISSLISLCDGRSSFSLGSTFNVPPDEVQLGYNVAKFVWTQALLRGWERAENWHGANTTVLRICQAASGAGDTYAISFHVGHSDRTYYQNGIHYYILDNNGNPTYDFVVHSFTSNRRTRFALIWSCWQAHEIGGSYDNTAYGPYGMPNAWLHTTSLSQDGYASPDGSGYSYIGWFRLAPFLGRTIDGAARAGYNFSLNFYAQALRGRTMRQALDYAAYYVWGYSSFSRCLFYTGFYLDDVWTQMRVYGDGNLVLP